MKTKQEQKNKKQTNKNKKQTFFFLQTQLIFKHDKQYTKK